MLNQVILVGRLTHSPTLTLHSSGKNRCSFSLAIHRSYKTDKGEVPVDFIDCTIWGKRAEVFAQNMAKGAMIGVIGEIHTWKSNKEKNIKYSNVQCRNFHYIEPRSVTQERLEKGGLKAAMATVAEEPLEVKEEDMPF